ncbi:MAG: hypothetical protein E7570_00770 [Ruminococcaceae bacterium]|nr:hypothetical protein [Oscillospiraceae bacterium]
MNKMIYNKPFFKVINASSEDVITTSFNETVFSQANGFTTGEESYSASSSTGFGGTSSTGIEL